MNSSISLLNNKLDEFIKKYYLNEIVKGILLFILFLLSYVLIISFSEYFLWLSIEVRTILFYLSILFVGFILVRYIIIPILHFFNKGNVLDKKSASKIISKHFPDIQDRLYNTLELSESISASSNDLLLASIEQRISLLKPIPFTLAVNIRANYKYVKYLGILLLFIIAISFIYPALLSEGTKRVINHSEYFEKEAPFSFNLLNTSLDVKKGEDIELKLNISGDYIPQFAELLIGSNSYLMKKIDATTFSYTLKNINNSISLSFKADVYTSDKYELNVLAVPKISSFKIEAITPSYTQIKSFTLENIGDIIVPQGSTVKWIIKCIDADSLYIAYDSLFKVSNFENNAFIYERVVAESFSYKIVPVNSNFKDQSLISYNVSVIPDIYPQITVQAALDSSNSMTYFYRGNISDDYGFSNLTFNYYFSENETDINSFKIDFNKNVTAQEFFYMFNFSEFSMGDNINYYFEVSDNDVLGYKSVKSSVYSFDLPDENELKQLADKSFQSLNNDVNKSLTLADELQKELNSLKRKFLDDKTSDWEKQQLIDDVKNKHNQLQNLLKDIAKSQEEKNKLFENLTEQKPELLDKQKQLQDLLEKMMDPELESLLEEFNKLKDDFQKDKFFDLSEEMKLSYEDLEKQLDKNIELFKRFEVEKNIEDAISKLENLSKQQEELKDQLDKLSDEDAKSRQDDINNKLDNLKDEYSDALKKNDELEDKMNLEEFEEQFQDIQNTQEQISDKLQDNKKNKSKDSMQKSSDDMQSLSDMMQQMMQQQQQQQASEDMNQLRQILDNLMTFSFDQEKLISKTKQTDRKDPKYVTLSVDQNRLKENFEVIEDSLYALASRNPQISTVITKEILSIKNDISQSVHALEQLKTSTSRKKQQYVMTSANNLALLLDEVLQQMQQSMAQQMSGQQQCQNPNGKGQGQSLSQLKQQQQSVKSQLQQMIEQMKQNSKPGMQTPGMSKQLSKMLQEQEQHKQMLQDMMNNSSFSPEAVKQLKEIEKMMKQNEKDIINRTISPQTMYRQEQIMSRLLEAENAERQREYDKKRESNEAKELYSKPEHFFREEEIEKNIQKEELEYKNLRLHNFYRKKYNEYLIKINK